MNHLAMILTAAGGVIGSVVSGYVMLRKGRSEVRKQEVETNTKEARAQQQIKQEAEAAQQQLKQGEEAWGVKEAREACRVLRKELTEVKLEMRLLTRSDRDCQIRLATYITRDRFKTARIRELERQLGIEHAPGDEDENLNRWADQTLADDAKRTGDGHDGQDPRTRD